MATYSNFLAWETPWTEGLQYKRLQTVGHNCGVFSLFLASGHLIPINNILDKRKCISTCQNTIISQLFPPNQNKPSNPLPSVAFPISPGKSYIEFCGTFFSFLQPGIKLGPSTVRVQSPHQQTTRELPLTMFFLIIFFLCVFNCQVFSLFTNAVHVFT